MSFRPAISTHLPLRHWLSSVQKQPWPDPVHAPPTALQPPTVQEYPFATDVEQPAVVGTQAPLHRVNPLLQVNVHALLRHSGWALAMLVEQGFPQVPQLAVSPVVSTHP